MLSRLQARLGHPDTAAWKRRVGLALLFVGGAFALPVLELADLAKAVSRPVRRGLRSLVVRGRSLPPPR